MQEPKHIRELEAYKIALYIMKKLKLRAQSAYLTAATIPSKIRNTERKTKLRRDLVTHE